jgi:hypothetical protein
MRPPESVIDWLKYLDSRKLHSTLFQFHPNPYPIQDLGLAIAILAKANGNIFYYRACWFPNFHQSWFIGLDLGKSAVEKRRKSSGYYFNEFGWYSLQAYWRAKKGMMGTLLAPVYCVEGLEWIVAKLML